MIALITKLADLSMSQMIAETATVKANTTIVADRSCSPSGHVTF